MEGVIDRLNRNQECFTIHRDSKHGLGHDKMDVCIEH